MPDNQAMDESNANVSFLDLPDDELGKYSPFAQPAVSPAVGDGSGAGAASAADAAAGSDDGAESGSDEVTSETAEAGEKPPEGTSQGEAAKEAQPTQADKPAAGADPKAEVKTETSDEAKPEVKDAGVDYEVEYKRLLAPFKANGKEIAVQSVDDAIALMQMGANYNKKMAALKPNLALLKMLENNGLLSEEKISYLIDLDKKVPGAVNKLVKDSGIDPMDLNADKASEYKPTARKADPRELELDEVLDSIQDSPTYARTLEIVSKQWDSESKQAIADAPQLLQVIDSHVKAGIYDLISAEIERERVFGRLRGLSDIQAYRQVGDAIHARGGFAHLGRQEQETPQQKVVVAPAPKKVDDDKLKEKKRAASPAKAAPAAQTATQDFNPLALSDEEFSKLVRVPFR